MINLTGITPAYAGNTTERRGKTMHNEGSPPPTRGTLSMHKHCRNVGKDHPRLRGEHHSATSVATNSGGSPPPTRGTLAAGLKCVEYSKDHPRLRGEHEALS